MACDSSPACFRPLTLHGVVSFGESHGIALHLHKWALQQLVQLVMALEKMTSCPQSGDS
uniref:Uncharacterized protein n=1 Tax=Arundo donax TaxID=35708 RepID=A0A0A9GL60_ARUDO